MKNPAPLGIALLLGLGTLNGFGQESADLLQDLEYLNFLNPSGQVATVNLGSELAGVEAEELKGGTKIRAFIDERINYLVNNKKPDTSNFLARNVGLLAYARGEATWMLDVQKNIGLRVPTPRIGIIEIGKMYTRLADTRPDRPHALINALERIGTLAHEARHSDGNGKSLGFFHAKCPVGHHYENRLACEKYTNGAYWVDLQLTQSFETLCPKKYCSSEDREYFRLMKKEYRSRVTENAERGDPNPVGSYQSPSKDAFQIIEKE